MFIDTHVHIFSHKIAAKAVEHLAEHYQIPVRYKGTREEYHTLARQAGVKTALFFTVATKPDQVRAANDWAITQSGNELIGLGTLHPDYEPIDDEIARLKEAGVRGVKFHPDFQQFFLDEERALAIYERLAKDFFIIFHMGDDNRPGKTHHATPERLANVLDIFPHLTVIAAHMGGYCMWDRAAANLVGENVYFDTSSCFGFLPDEDFRTLIREHGAHRVLMASDYPYSSPGEEIEGLKKLGLNDEELEAITGLNAAQLLSKMGL
ncbi:MAG: amidohydrolase family protein [Peptococcaceae bacterium]|nr:amidohydrolase family protein [Peptococcaceae bacterium]